MELLAKRGAGLRRGGTGAGGAKLCLAGGRRPCKGLGFSSGQTNGWPAFQKGAAGFLAVFLCFPCLSPASEKAAGSPPAEGTAKAAQAPAPSAALPQAAEAKPASSRPPEGGKQREAAAAPAEKPAKRPKAQSEGPRTPSFADKGFADKGDFYSGGSGEELMTYQEALEKYREIAYLGWKWTMGVAGIFDDSRTLLTNALVLELQASPFKGAENIKALLQAGGIHFFQTGSYSSYFDTSRRIARAVEKNIPAVNDIGPLLQAGLRGDFGKNAYVYAAAGPFYLDSLIWTGGLFFGWKYNYLHLDIGIPFYYPSSSGGASWGFAYSLGTGLKKWWAKK